MCGITGFLSPHFTDFHLQQMTDAVAHRGPDAAGYYTEPENHLGLGHRRLSILDLSEVDNDRLFSLNLFLLNFIGDMSKKTLLVQGCSRAHTYGS